MAGIITLDNFDFNTNFFYSYMKNIFGESLAHSSLAFEKVFTEGKIYGRKLEEFMSPENTEYYYKLINGSDEDKQLLEQRRQEIMGALIQLGVPKERIQIDEEEYSSCIEDFNQYLPGIVRPFRNSYEYQLALENNKTTGAPYEKDSLLSRIKLIIFLVNEKIKADQTAYKLKKGNNEAFLYSLKLPTLTVKDIIEINALVNNEAGIKKGFKSSNNDIYNAPFTPCPKELVPIKMQELMYKYNNEWAQEIPKFQDGISSPAEKNAWLKAICEREAKFHIEFERIHPFEDGNGRTGRIILNKNLIANGLAPVLITTNMHDEYIECIGQNDYRTLGKLLLILSSQTHTLMVSEYRDRKRINPDNIDATAIIKTKTTDAKTCTILTPQEDFKKPMFQQNNENQDEENDIKIYTIGTFKKSK